MTDEQIKSVKRSMEYYLNNFKPENDEDNFEKQNIEISYRELFIGEK